MNAIRHRWPTVRRLLASGLACAVVSGTGCRLFEKDHPSPGDRSSRDDRPDPLLGGHRIPPTNLPVPGKDNLGKERRDPLLGSPTGRDDRSTNDRPRDPFRNGPETTAAGLTARLATSDDMPGIGDRREPVIPAGGVRLTKPEDDERFEDATAELKRFRATWGEPTRDGSNSVLRVDVPVEGGTEGAVRRYEGVGRTTAAAAADALKQIKSDRGL